MPIEEDYDFLFKIVIVGDTNVGKTQMLSRFIQNQFTFDSKPTVGVQFGTKTIKVGDVWVKNQIWDTAGQQKFRALTCAYYRGAVGAIVVFDLSKSVTFQHVQRWIREVRQNSEPDVCVLLVGNKNDIEVHQVREEEIYNFSANHKLTYVSTSAATGLNVELAFQTLMKQILGHTDPDEKVQFSDSEDDPTPGQNNQKQVNYEKNENNENNNKNIPQNVEKGQQKVHKRQKPRIQAFSIQQKPSKTKIKDNTKAKKQKQKKKCC